MITYTDACRANGARDVPVKLSLPDRGAGDDDALGTTRKKGRHGETQRAQRAQRSRSRRPGTAHLRETAAAFPP